MSGAFDAAEVAGHQLGRDARRCARLAVVLVLVVAVVAVAVVVLAG